MSIETITTAADIRAAILATGSTITTEGREYYGGTTKDGRPYNLLTMCGRWLLWIADNATT